MAVKIKKTVPLKPRDTNELLDFIRKDNVIKKEKDLKNYFNNKRPSQFGYFTKWKNKDIEEWNNHDFIGFYLYSYLSKVKEEDMDFTGRTKQYTFGKESGMISRCRKMFFEGENEKFKNYIEFIIKWWLSEESFVTGYPTYASIFTTKATFVKIYKESKLNINKKVKSVKRKDIDNSFAAKKAWDEYFDGGEDNV